MARVVQKYAYTEVYNPGLREIVVGVPSLIFYSDAVCDVTRSSVVTPINLIPLQGWAHA